MEEANFNFCLNDGSHCIGNATDSFEANGIWYHAPSKDFEGNPRSDQDVGAFENDLTTGYFWNNYALIKISYEYLIK
jgi:hypothetical protein